jgi:pyruvate,water dikinase
MTLRLLGDQLRAGYDHDRRAAAAAERRGAAHDRARAKLSGHAESDLARFERTLERARRWYHVREDEAPMTFSEQFALIRQVALEMGRRLVQSSLLDDPEDVFFLELPEAMEALLGRTSGTVPECRGLAARRRAERAWVEAHPGPPSYGTEPTTLPGVDGLPPDVRFPTEAMLWLVERSGHFTPPANPQPRGDRLTGIPVSGGTYTGTARVLLDEADFAKLRPGDVLVCPITSPAWSVLFPNVGALVADAGGLMAHSAIIAREFQIPAVVSTGNATTVLRDGQRVTVNGTDGSVEVVA